MSSINVDGNLAALAAYERDLDRAQRYDDWLAELEDEIWEDGQLFETAMRRAPTNMTIEDAVTEYARLVMAERIRLAEIARGEMDRD